MNRKKLLSLALLLLGFIVLMPSLQPLLMLPVERLLGHSLNLVFWKAGLSHLAAELMLFGALLLMYALKLFEQHFYKIAAASILVFFTYVFASNISLTPLTDDAKNFLEFAISYKHTTSFFSQLSILFTSVGEYKLVLPHLAVMASMLLFGKVSFVFLLSLGFCFLLMILLVLRQGLRIDFKSLCLLVLFCHCAYFDALFWAASSLTIVSTTLLVSLVLLALTKSSLNWSVTAFFLACLAAFTAPYGILAFILAVIYTVYMKRWWSACFWIASSLLMGSLLYTSIPSAISANSSVSLLNFILFSFIFLGSALQFGHNLLFPALLGMCFWILFGVIIVKGIYKKHPMLTGLVIYCLACSVLASLFRIHRGIDLALSNRYVFFSLLLAACYLLLFWDTLQIHTGIRFRNMLFASLLVYHLAAGLFFFPELPLRKAKLAKYAKDLRSNTPFVPIKPLVTVNTHATVMKAIEEGVWEAE